MSLAARKEVGVASQGRPDPALPGAREAAARPHLCFVAPYLWPVFAQDRSIPVVGGAEVQQAILARLFARAGYRVSIITHDYGQPDGVVLDGVTVRKAFRPEEGVPVLRFVHPRLTSMWRVMGEVDADIYYQRSSAVWTGIVAEFCRRRGKRAIYAGASDRDFEPGREQIALARDRWIFHRGVASVDRVVAQNAHQVETLRKHYGREAVLIPSVYEVPREKNKSSEKKDRVLWVGTIHDYKRPEMLLELARRLPHRRFVMVGGPAAGGDRFKPGYFEGIRDEAAKLPNVEFTGFLPLAEVEAWFDRARVVVSTSVYEGMPNVFLQAWARGVPTVATVDVGVAAHTVFPDLERGVSEIERFFTDEDSWKSKAKESLEYFQATHGPEAILARYERLFEELR